MKTLAFSLLGFLYSSFLFSQSFVTTWETTTANESIAIPTTGTGYNYSVSWGDGSTQSGITGNATHVYTSPGIYTVSISGDFARIYFNNTGDALKIKSIEQWGTIAWKSMGNAFYGCSSLVYNATDAPDLTNVANIGGMFRGCTSFDGDLSNWDVSTVTYMASLFEDASMFNGSIGGWNVSNAVYMFNMFSGASAFDQDISAWNTSNVQTMQNMFRGATSFNQDISTWNTEKVINTNAMFYEATSFNQNIGQWVLSADTAMNQMFLRATAFNGDISNWDVSSVRNMSYMFYEATNFNQNLTGWDVSAVKNMEAMFYSATSFNGDVGGWDVSSVRSMHQMFYGAASFNQPINGWNTGGVTTMYGMFGYASSFDQDLNDWNVSVVTDMGAMFFNATAFNGNISAWNVSSVTEMDLMFSAANLFNGNIGAWDVSAVTDMNLMFANAWSFDQDLGGWNIQNVTNMNQMLISSGMSVESMDNTLIKWADLTVQNGIAFGGGGLRYCAAEAAKTKLVTTFGWTISAVKNCVNIAPVRLRLSATTIDENNSLNDVVGSLITNDQNAADTHTYTFVAGTGDMDNGSFALSGDQLLAGDLFDYETKASYSVRIQADDGHGGQLAQGFVITINNTREHQAIIFAELPERTFGDASFELTATSSAGLPITYQSSDETVATIVGGTVTIVGAGSATITAQQDGDAQYYGATPVQRPLLVNKAAQTITVTQIADKSTEDPAFDVTASTTSGLPLTYSVSGPATISNTTVALDGTEGTVSVTVNQDGNGNYEAATMTITFEVIKAIVSTYDPFAGTQALYPNPTRDILTVQHPENIVVELFDSMGRSVLVKAGAGRESTLQLQNMPPGLYFIRLGEAQVRYRVIKY